MLIQCTKKLLDELKIKPEAQIEENPLFSWHANLLMLGRKNTLVLVNDKNRYTIVLFGLKAKEWKNIDTYIKMAIREVFLAEGIKEEIVEQFVSAADNVVFTKTKDRTSVARMNKSCENVYYFDDIIDPQSIIQKSLSLRLSDFLVGDGKNDYFHPNEALYKDLEEWTDGSVFRIQAAQIKVTLELGNKKVWRRLTVPTSITFSAFHDVLQAAFGWQNSHLHDFLIYPPNTVSNVVVSRHRNSPILNLVCAKEALEYERDIPMKMENEVKLSEHLSSRMQYNYDFGDNWIHTIEVEKVLENHELNRPVCLRGEGNTPPEDVGGEPGYKLFLQTIQNKKHPDHDYMKKWAENQGYEKFDIEKTNQRLKWI
ncbi:plasmid pRiA4b ORF-3 family protein [Bacillus tianshenii]|uniref:plasmid pRiA4b ORF-3 family protein n=1 Tax=Sutcliffiella tianshenii TaxID=1463404 RepID=UPI001CD4384E|nr:plasmid pRiA4b ORF-3 family protein [Bacillus tianshenii]MCA1321568.1 plasmid pRiA4b ORF-3 family protein [Bacillus tianshenii]